MSGEDTRDGAVRGLLQQIARLRALHRAGLQPAYGEIESLFDDAVALEPAFDAAAGPGSWVLPVKTASRIETAAIRFVNEGRFPVRGVDVVTAGLLAELSSAVEGGVS